MKHRKESSSWTRLWRRLEVLTVYGHEAEILKSGEEHVGPCQPQPARKLPRRNARAGQNGRPLGERNKRACFIAHLRYLLPFCYPGSTQVNTMWTLSAYGKRALPSRAFRSGRRSILDVPLEHRAHTIGPYCPPEKCRLSAVI